MCMASFFPGGIMPVESELRSGAEINPDGHGFAIVTRDRKLIIQRGMDADQIIAEFMRRRKEHPEGPALFHSRIATSGRVDVTGCHPFKVGSDNRTVLAHNGVLFQPGKDSERSDTAIFADVMLPRFGSLDSAKKMRNLQRFIGSGNKLIILTVNPARRKTSYIVNETAGIWAESGAWHSNYDYAGRWWNDDNYLAYGVTNAGKPKVVRYGFSVFACEVCGAYDSVSTADSVCEVCNACNDCKMHIMNCLCYVPRTARVPAITVGAGDHSS